MIEPVWVSVDSAGGAGRGDAEVHDLELAFVVDQDIARLEIAVDDALFVRGGHAAGDLVQNLETVAGIRNGGFPSGSLRVRGS